MSNKEHIRILCDILKHCNITFIHKSNKTFIQAEYQQYELINLLSVNTDFIKYFSAKSIQQYCCDCGKIWDSKTDLRYGDVIITTKNNELVCCIDLKVGQTEKYYGAITLRSLFYFGNYNNSSNYDNNLDKCYYLLCTCDGKTIFVNRNELFKLFKQQLLHAKENNYIIEDLINASNDRKYLLKVNNKYVLSKDINVKIWFNKLNQFTDNGYLYGEDFINYKIFNKHPELNLLYRTL
jgi:hypothetical protein